MHSSGAVLAPQPGMGCHHGKPGSATSPRAVRAEGTILAPALAAWEKKKRYKDLRQELCPWSFATALPGACKAVQGPSCPPAALAVPPP